MARASGITPSPFPHLTWGLCPPHISVEPGAPETLGGLADRLGPDRLGEALWLRRSARQIPGPADPAQLHTRLHRGEGPCACPDCGRSHAAKAHLLLHQRSHPRRVTSYLLQCDKRFSKKAHLTRHLRTHTGRRAPTRVPNAASASARKIHLGSHQRRTPASGPSPASAKRSQKGT